MKITAFDDLYPSQLASGGTLLVSSSGSNTGVSGGDVDGEAGDLTVIGLRGDVSLASNLALGRSIGDVLTLVQMSPTAVAQFATPSNTASFGSNSTRVSASASAGAASSSARSDHIHDGIGTVTASASNTLGRGTLNIRQGNNISLGWTDTDGDGQLDTVTIHGSAAGGGSVSAGSNSTRVSEASSAGASTTQFSPFDHRHDGIGTVTASSSNTMQRGTLNLRSGTNVAFGLTDTDGDGELDTITVHASASAAAISALGFRGELLISSTPSNPIVFGDVMLNSDGTDFVYASIPE